MLLWTLRFVYLFKLVFLFSSDIYPVVGLLDNMITQFFILWGTSILFSMVAAPIYSIIYILLEFPFLYIPSNICYLCVCMYTKSCPTLCYPICCSSPGSSVHRLLWAKLLEWIAISFSRGSLWPRDRTKSLASSALVGGFFTSWATGEALVIYRHFNNSQFGGCEIISHCGFELYISDD